MNPDYCTFTGGLAQTQQGHVQSTIQEQPLNETLACPYCACELFDRDDALWYHVRSRHDAQIHGVKEGISLFRKLLRDEALHKAKQIASTQRQLHIDEQRCTESVHTHDAQQRTQTLDLNRLILQKSPDRSPIRQDAKTHQEPSSTSTSLAPPPASNQAGVLPMPTNEQWPDLVLQLDSRPVSQEQLAAEVKSIYVGLTMVESKCMHVDKEQAAIERDPMSGQQPGLAPDHWQGLIALHRTLLHEHYDFFLASQHPLATPALRRLAAKYSMPARMWKHGIHSFLELLRHRLPESLEYMLTFVYLAYQMMAILYEAVPAFKDTWIECLGDLGRYRMAIEDDDLWTRGTWTGVAYSWYSKAADESPAIGRLYHHLAILARPEALRQLYLYCRSLTCVQPFTTARESILTLFDPILGLSNRSYSYSSPVGTNFIRTHALLFEQDQESQQHKFDRSLSEFVGQLDNSIGRVTSKWEEGAYMAIANLASLFDYGSEDNFLRLAFATQLQKIVLEQLEKNNDMDGLYSNSVLPPTQPAPDGLKLDLEAATTFPSACRLTFDTLHVVLRRFGDKNVLTYFHILLAFLSQLATLPYDTSYIFSFVRWEEVASFLNTLANSETITRAIESPSFLHEGEEDFRPLPEDYIIRGQIWAHSYYPATWFGDVVDEEERVLELASTIRSRIERILWLGIRLSSNVRHLNYDGVSRTWAAGSLGDTG